MLKISMIGYLGRDAIMQQHGTDSVLNFSVCHTDKYKDGYGNLVERATWVNCSWWIDAQSKVGQYLKKGTLVYIDGHPGTKMWDKSDGKKECGLTLRIIKLELLGGKRDDGSQPQQSTSQNQNNNNGYVPVGEDNDPLPF